MTTHYHDILDPNRLHIFQHLRELSGSWVLAGGTGLAMQIGHRKSYDFDLFSKDPISESAYRSMSTVFNEQPTKLVDSHDQLTVSLSSGVEITCLYYWYTPLFPLIQTESVPLFDFRDIAADKARTLRRRNMWRDYVDIYTLLAQKRITLEELLDVSQRKFGNEFSKKLFLEQLCYTKDIHDQAIEWILQPTDTSSITEFFNQEVTRYLHTTILPKEA